MSEIDKKRVLIVVKEEDLATGIAEVLNALGYDCVFVRAGSTKTSVEVQEALAKVHFDLVVAQQRMSPYSAANLLHDVEKADGTGVPAVICLAENDSDHNAFIRQGGSGFVVLEPGTVNLTQALGKGLDQVQKHREHKKASKSNVLRVIDGFTKEVAFQDFVLKIFRELEYSGVRASGGPLEEGKDIVCWERNRMGYREYVGVQIKLGDVTGGSGTSGLTELSREALEAFLGHAAFVDGDRDLDKYVIITAGRMNEPARQKLSDFARKLSIHRRIYFLDREELADLVVNSCPALLARLE